MNLLIDMGNTRLKWAVYGHGRLHNQAALANHQLDGETLKQQWQPLPIPKQIAIACVSASPLLTLVESISTELWPGAPIFQAKSQAQACGVTNAYQQPEKLGVDRWLALIAAHRHYPAAVCVVDCGTAITVDLLEANGEHRGGYISPGLALMKQALAQGTNALPFISGHYPDQPALSTEAAIHSGTLLAARGLIEHVLATRAAPSQLLLTGGDASIIAEHLNIPAVIDSDLVLCGLAIVLEEGG
ncbi:MAG: type III pantothenate kinase [Methylovulum sp.]|uniref:type III pantothenate kinase n=1 Tax=Methylovulum sp. TaxID=1916980 RepID=UPI0026367D44|nr:type III pantothenate kinase [Methylovulum sp.]MDD2723719.1 type III pantothenate kinase [Methylovulum sp.]MDD5123307.1 type III pantothenate kinase [Methylovulum sp.]